MLVSLNCTKKAVLLAALETVLPAESRRVGEDGVKVPVPTGTAKVNVAMAEAV